MFLPGLEAGGLPGRYFTFTNPEIGAKYKGQLEPYRGLFGMTTQEPYQGTLIRLPFRNDHQAQHSELRSSAFHPIDAAQLFIHLASLGAEVLLFLRHIESIGLHVWHQGHSTPVCVHRACLNVPRSPKVAESVSWVRRGLDEWMAARLGGRLQSEKDRHRAFAELLENLAAGQFQEQEANITFTITTAAGLLGAIRDRADDSQALRGEVVLEFTLGSLHVSREELWHVRSGVASPNSKLWTLSREHIQDTLLPAGGLALLISRRSQDPESTDGWTREELCSVRGRAFCFLPLPIQTGLPVHLQGRFALGRNRRSLYSGIDAFDKRHLVIFNQGLLLDSIAPMYARALLRVSEWIGCETRSDLLHKYFCLWPCIETGLDAPWCDLVPEATQQAFRLPALPIGSAPNIKWKTAEKIRFFESNMMTENLMQDLSLAYQSTDLSDEARKCVRHGLDAASPEFFSRLGDVISHTHFPLVFVPPQFAKSAVAYDVPIAVLTPVDVRDLLAEETRSQKNQLVLGTSAFSFLSKLEDVETLLRFCLMDLNPDDSSSYRKLHDVPLLLLASDKLLSFSQQQEDMPDKMPAVVVVPEDIEVFDPSGCMSSEARACKECLAHPHIIERFPEFQLPSFRNALGLSTTTADQIARLLRKLLPASWIGRVVTEWNPENRQHPSQDWIDKLWAFLRRQDEFEIEEALCDLPLVPTADFSLVPVKDVGLVFDCHEFHGNAAQLRRTASGRLVAASLSTLVDQRKEDSSDLSIKFLPESLFGAAKVLSKIGLYFLHPSAMLPDSLMLNNLTGLGVVRALHSLLKQKHASDPFSSLSISDSSTLLNVIARDVDRLGDAEVAFLREMPIFQAFVDASNHARHSKLVSLNDEQWFFPPADIPLSDLHVATATSRMLHQSPSWQELYVRLGVCALSKKGFFLNYLIPAVQSPGLSDSQRLQTCRCLRSYWAALVGDPDEHEINSAIQAASFLVGPDGALHKAARFVDPSLPFLQEVREGWLPKSPYSDPEWLPFLRDAGLLSTLDCRSILCLAQEIADSGISTTTVQRGGLLVRYIYDQFSAVDATPEFWSELKNIPFVPTAPVPVERFSRFFSTRQMPDIGFRPKLLCAFQEIADPYEAAIVWSQVPIFSQGLAPPYTLRKYLDLRTVSTDPRLVVRHLVFTRDSFAGTTLRVQEFEEFSLTLKSIYRFLDSEASLRPKATSELILSELGCSPWLWMTSSTYWRSLDSKTRPITFASPQSVFFELEHDLPPYLFRLPSWLANSCNWLLEACGVKDLPTEAVIVDILRDVAGKYEGRPIAPPDSSTVASLLLSLGKKSSQTGLSEDTRALMMLPDQNFVLCPAKSLLFQDAPWLEGKIDDEACRLVHSSVPAALCRAIPLRTTSTSIVESADPTFEPQACDAYPDRVTRWRANLGTEELRLGIRRLLAHEEAEKPTQNVQQADTLSGERAEIERRIEKLPELQIRTVRNLRTRFLLLPDHSHAFSATLEDLSSAADVTKDGSGATSLVDIGAKTIFLVAPHSANMLLSSLAMEINRFLLGHIINLQPLSIIMDEVPEGIMPALNMMRIRALPSSQSSRKLGTQMDISDEQMLRPLDGEQFVLGMPVGVKMEKLAEGRVYGEVRCEIGEGVFLVDLGNLGLRKIHSAQIQRLLGRREWLHEQQLKEAERLHQERENDGGINASYSMEQVGDQVPGQKPELTERVLYAPDPELWEEEKQLLDKIRSELELPVEQEPANIDQVLIAQEPELRFAAELQTRTRKNVRPGYDIVRWGNICEVAFFMQRNLEMTESLMKLAQQAVEVLRDVAKVFDYNAYLVTLFYQPNTISRFIQQTLLFNIWQIEEHALKNNVDDIRKDLFTYCYFYGLFVHKLGHFHDIVHGTRHDYFMNEIRAEFAMEWMALLESKGFDPSRIESGQDGWMVQQVVF